MIKFIWMPVLQVWEELLITWFILFQFRKVIWHIILLILRCSNVVVVLKVWGQCWADKHMQIWCDNSAVVDMLRYGRARGTVMATCASNVWLLTAIYNIALTHIEGENNSVADLFSRWMHSPQDYNKLHNFIPNQVWMNTRMDLTLLNHDL